MYLNKHISIGCLAALFAGVQLCGSCSGKDQQQPIQQPGIKPAPPATARVKKLIALQPLHGFPAQITTAASKYVAGHYEANVQVLPEQAVPSSFITRVKTTRYRADSLLQWLRRNKPAGVDYVAGLTTRDISCTKYDSKGNVLQPAERYADWGVFGLGYMPGAACVISLHRLQKGTAAQVTERVAKVVLHELGHNMGLPHCPNACFMRDAVEKLSTVDDEPMQLCSGCMQKLGLQ